MKKEFNSYAEAISWIAQFAITKSHVAILRKELEFNHDYTGYYFIHTIISEN